MSTTSTGTGQVALGGSGLLVSPVCLGGNVFGWSAGEEDSHAVLDAYREAGGTLVDTADVYSAWVDGHTGGESEAVIGRWLARSGAGEGFHVATKTGALEGDDLSPRSVRRALQASLGRLGVGAVSLYYAHRDEPDRPVEEVVQAFGALVDEGLARSWGVSNWTAERIDAAVAAADAAGLPRPAALQNAGSAVTRTDPDAAAAADRAGMLQLPYGALAAGFLTGKYARGGDAVESVRAEGVAAKFADDRGWAVLDAVREVAEGRGAELSTIAVAWVRSQGAVPIASARTPRQLPALLAAVTTELSADEVERITAAGA